VNIQDDAGGCVFPLKGKACLRGCKRNHLGPDSTKNCRYIFPETPFAIYEIDDLASDVCSAIIDCRREDPVQRCAGGG
jgi:hypothetical protein